MDRSQDRLKGAFSRGQFDEEFIELCKGNLPYLWGRLSLLEEFYSITMRGGDRDRIPQLHEQLGKPKPFHGSPLRKLWAAITG